MNKQEKIRFYVLTVIAYGCVGAYVFALFKG